MPQNKYSERCYSNTVRPVEHNGIRYTSPKDEVGYIIATDIKTEKTIWTKQIYKKLTNKIKSVDYKRSLIQKLSLKNNELKIYNKKKETIYLDIISREVTKLNVD